MFFPLVVAFSCCCDPKVCSLEDGSAGSDPSQDDGDAASVAFAAAAALQRADRLQLKSGALAPSEIFLDAITRILQVLQCAV